MREMKKGSLSLLLLSLLSERPSYGYALCERLRERSDGALSFEDGAIYPLLHSFERSGLVEGYWETEIAVAEENGNSEAALRKGPRRRFYRLTPRGEAELRTAQQEWQTFSEGVSRVIGTARPGLA
jgi:DNA-binding PadR family transcriptional regulator